MDWIESPSASSSLPPVINQDLSDEIQAINAIFGDGTLQVVPKVNGGHGTRVRFMLPRGVYDANNADDPDRSETVLLEERGVPETTKTGVIDCVFLMVFSDDYPGRPPVIMGMDAELKDYREECLWKVHLLLFAVLNLVYVPGHVCLFDLLELGLPLVACMGRDGLEIAKAQRMLPGFELDEKDWRWSFQQSINMSRAFSKESCTICLDDALAYKLLALPCGHLFCIDCFEDGWKVASEINEVYTCCLKRIPLRTIQQFANLTEQHTRKYRRMLAERDITNPLFCAIPSCSELIGSIDVFKSKNSPLAQLCKSCNRYTCYACRQSGHGRVCTTDSFDKRLLKEMDVRRCGKCGVGIEKNGGCTHMVCTSCGTHHSWQSDGGLVVMV